MKLVPPDQRRAISAIRLSLALTVMVTVPLLLYAGPAWWSERNVLVQNAISDDYAPANQGQLKNIAAAAIAEMDAKLAGGAGEELHNLVTSWSAPSAQTNDFSPVNLGQLKKVALPFYDRLIAMGIVDRYPWLSSLDPADDFAVANIGQVKKLFSFEIRGANVVNDTLQDRLAAGQRCGNLALELQSVWFWGKRFGSDSTFQSMFPRRLTSMGNIRSVSAGDDHVVILTVAGEVLTWGKNIFGQLGDGTFSERQTPATIPSVSNIRAVKAGATHTLALQADGTVLAWGDNYYGELGIPAGPPSSSPVQVIGLTDVRKIATGPSRSAAVTTNGTVWIWGYDHYAWQTGQDISSAVPIQVPGLADVIDVAAGSEHFIALKADGTVWTWGSNYSNQLGNGSPTWIFQEAPAQVPILGNIKKIASNFDSSLAVSADGTVWAWGANSFGQLGNGTTNSSQMPLQVQGLTDVVAVACTYTDSLAMKEDGTVWAWGDGASGVLPNVDLHVPQQVGLGLFDPNHNGMDDRWEMEYFGNLDQSGAADFDGDGISNLKEYLRGTNPRDYFNGIAPVIELVSGNNQIGDPNAVLRKPVTVRLRDASGAPVINAPVEFKSASGGATLATAIASTFQDTVIGHTDSTGQCAAYVMLPSIPGASVRVTASPAVPSSTSSPFVAFRVVTRFTLPPIPTPTPDPKATPSPTASPSASPTPRPPYRYAIIDLGKDVYPSRITNSGWVLDYRFTAQGYPEWHRGKAGVSETLQCNNGESFCDADVTDINEAGTVVGRLYAGQHSHEPSVGAFWRVGSSASTKVASFSVPWIGPFLEPATLKYSACYAIDNSNSIFGQAVTDGTGGRIGQEIEFYDFGYLSNSCQWSLSGGLPTILSNAKYKNATKNTWSGQTDSISRVNSSGHFIGRTVIAIGDKDFFAGPITITQASPMIDGHSIDFNPVDINEAGIVVGNRSSEGTMIIRAPGLADTTIVDPAGARAIAINDHTRPGSSPTAQTSPTATPLPTPIPAPQVLSRTGNALVLWELQPDGKTWHPFGLEEMIPSMDGWDYLTAYDMNDNGLIVGTAWYTDPSNPTAPGEQHGFMLVPVEVMVDGNRDGEMSFDDPAIHEADQTSEDKPYSFWLNDDQDATSGTNNSEEVIPVQLRDSQDERIQSVRDCEDLTRLWLNIRGLTESFKTGALKFVLKFRNVTSGNPAVRVFRAAENGGRGYITNEGWGVLQASPPFDAALPGTNGPGIASSTTGIHVHRQFWQGIDEVNPIINLLFEGVEEGEGELYFEIIDASGRRIGTSPGVSLNIKNVQKMYERAKITLDAPNIPAPWNNGHPPSLAWAWDSSNGTSVDSNATAQTIVYVHGWRITYDEYLSWANTTFKRLFHAGYKGRFFSFHWPTFNGENNGPDPVDLFVPGGATYNPSEYRAWLSGPALANFVNSLPNPNARYLLAHSMGNVVAGAALRSGMTVTRYAMCNSAMAAMAYDGNLSPDDPGYQTPDTDPDVGTRQAFGLGNRFNPAGTEIVNFSLPNDYALGQWSENNKLFKPQVFPDGTYYFYSAQDTVGHKLGYVTPTHNIQYVTSQPEAMAYVTKSRTRAAGSRQDTGGAVVSFVNMGLGGFEFGDEHSAEWVYTTQKTYLFWREVLKKFDLDVQ